MRSYLFLSPFARFYVAAVTIGGFITIARAFPTIGDARPLLLAVMLCLSLIASIAKVNIPVPGSASSLSVCHVIDYTTLIVCGPEAAVIVAGWGAWTQCMFFGSGRNPPHQIAFSIAALAVSMDVAGWVYTWLGGQPGLLTGVPRFEPFIAAATTYFLLNSGFVAGAVGASTGRSTPTLWFESFLTSWPSYAIGAALAAGIATVLERGTYWVLPLLAGPLVLLHRNFVAYIERMDHAVTDRLTGLPNQRFMSEHIERELARCRRTGNPLAVIFTDLDGFKALNDRGGHAIGDAALARVAQCLRTAIRSHDVCARYGGDEFVLVLSDCGLDEAHARMEQLQLSIRSLIVDAAIGVRMSLNISAGVAVFPDDGETQEQLLVAADRRMYEAKFRTARTRQISA